MIKPPVKPGIAICFATKTTPPKKKHLWLQICISKGALGAQPRPPPQKKKPSPWPQRRGSRAAGRAKAGQWRAGQRWQRGRRPKQTSEAATACPMAASSRDHVDSGYHEPLFIEYGGVPGFSGDLSPLEGNTPHINRTWFINPGSTLLIFESQRQSQGNLPLEVRHN